jgi:hypothetical protein
MIINALLLIKQTGYIKCFVERETWYWLLICLMFNCVTVKLMN